LDLGRVVCRCNSVSFVYQKTFCERPDGWQQNSRTVETDLKFKISEISPLRFASVEMTLRRRTGGG
jgi:hypothetical protein